MAENPNLRKEATKATKDIEILLGRMRNHRSEKQKGGDKPAPPVRQPQLTMPQKQASGHHAERQEDQLVDRELSSVKHSLGIVHHSKHLVDNLQLIKGEVGKLLQEKESLQQKLLQADAELHQQRSIGEQLRTGYTEAHARLSDTLKQAEGQGRRFKEKVLELEGALQAQSEERRKVEVALQQAKQFLEQMRNEKEQLLAQNESTRASLEKLLEASKVESARLRESNQASIHEHNGQISRLTDTISDSNRQLAQLMKERQAEQKTHEEFIESLTQQLQDYQEQCTALRSQAQSKERQLSQVQLESQQQSALKVTEIAGLVQINQQKDSQVEALKGEITAAQVHHQCEVEKLTEQSRGQQDRLEAQLNSRQQERAAVSYKLERAKLVEKDLQRRLEDLQGVNDALSTERDEHEKTREEVRRLSLEVLKTTSELSSTKAELEKARGLIVDKESELAHLALEIEEERKGYESDVKELQATIALQYEKISTESLVTEELKRVLSRRVDRQVQQIGTQTQPPQGKPADESPISELKQSDTPALPEKEAVEAESPQNAAAKDSKIKNQFETINALTKRLTETEERHQLQQTRSREAISLLREQLVVQKQQLLGENIQLKGLVAKLSVPCIQGDFEDECIRKLKLLANSLRNLQSLADQEQISRNELVDKIIELARLVDILKLKIHDMSQQQQPDIFLQPSPQLESSASAVRSRRGSGWRKVIVRDSEGQYFDRPEMSCQTEPSHICDQYKRVESILVTESIHVSNTIQRGQNPQWTPTLNQQLQTEAKVSCDAGHQTELQEQHRRDVQLQTPIIMTEDKHIGTSHQSSPVHNQQQTVAVSTSSCEIQTAHEVVSTASAEQQTPMLTTIDQQHQSEARLDMNSQRTINVMVHHPTQLQDNQQQTDAAPIKAPQQKEQQTTSSLANQRDFELQTDTTPVESVTIQTAQTLESMHNEAAANSHRIRQLQDSIQTKTSHYMRLVEALNEEIAFLKDYSRTE